MSGAEEPVQTVPELLRARVASYPDTELLVTPTAGVGKNTGNGKVDRKALAELLTLRR